MQVGFTPLLQASQDGHLGVVKALVEHDPEMGLDETSKVVISYTAGCNYSVIAVLNVTI